MKSSRFAVSAHILVVLAEFDGEPVPSEQLAQSVGTSPGVIRQLLVRLRRAGLVESVLGPGGGTKLTRAPGAISMRHIYDAVEDAEVIQTHRCEPDQDCIVGRNILDVLDTVIDSAENAMRTELGHHSVADLKRRVRRKAKA